MDNYIVHWDIGSRHYISGGLDFAGAQDLIAAIKMDYPNAIFEIRRPRKPAATVGQE